MGTTKSAKNNDMLGFPTTTTVLTEPTARYQEAIKKESEEADKRRAAKAKAQEEEDMASGRIRVKEERPMPFGWTNILLMSRSKEARIDRTPCTNRVAIGQKVMVKTSEHVTSEAIVTFITHWHVYLDFGHYIAPYSPDEIKTIIPISVPRGGIHD